MVRGSWRPNITATFWPPLLWPSALCLSCSLRLLNWRPRGPALCWMMAFFTASYQQLVWSPTHRGLQGPLPPGFLYHILSATSLDPNSIGGPEDPFGLAWLFLPHLVSNSNWSLTVLTELYNSSTPTQSPTQSLEGHVWSSSSGNNCHAVQRSLSSGVSVYECTMGCFTLYHFVNQVHLRDFLSLLPLECVTSFRCITLGWQVWPGRRSKYNNIKLTWLALSKLLLTKTSLLRFYDPIQTTVFSTVASSNIVSRSRRRKNLIVFALCTLTTAERNYAWIKKIIPRNSLGLREIWLVLKKT